MSAQLDLFSAPAPKPRITREDRLRELVFSDPVKAEVLEILSMRAGEWLTWGDFSEIIRRHEIGFCFGHLLSHMGRAGQLLVQERYFGGQYPWEENFMGHTAAYATIGTEGPLVVTHTCAKPSTVKQSALKLAVAA